MDQLQNERNVSREEAEQPKEEFDHTVDWKESFSRDGGSFPRDGVMPEKRERVLLRPWLEATINSGKIPGLEWINDERTMFKVPWKHRSKKTWSLRHSSVFLEWAKNTGRWSEGDPEPNYAQLKTRLRCAFNKAPDMEEMKELHFVKSEEPYKVYRFRPRRDNKFLSLGRKSWTSMSVPMNLRKRRLFMSRPVGSVFRNSTRIKQERPQENQSGVLKTEIGRAENDGNNIGTNQASNRIELWPVQQQQQRGSGLILDVRFASQSGPVMTGITTSDNTIQEIPSDSDQYRSLTNKSNILPLIVEDDYSVSARNSSILPPVNDVQKRFESRAVPHFEDFSRPSVGDTPIRYLYNQPDMSAAVRDRRFVLPPSHESSKVADFARATDLNTVPSSGFGVQPANDGPYYMEPVNRTSIEHEQQTPQQQQQQQKQQQWEPDQFSRQQLETFTNIGRAPAIEYSQRSYDQPHHESIRAPRIAISFRDENNHLSGSSRMVPPGNRDVHSTRTMLQHNATDMDQQIQPHHFERLHEQQPQYRQRLLQEQQQQQHASDVYPHEQTIRKHMHEQQQQQQQQCRQFRDQQHQEELCRPQPLQKEQQINEQTLMKPQMPAFIKPWNETLMKQTYDNDRCNERATILGDSEDIRPSIADRHADSTCLQPIRPHREEAIDLRKKVVASNQQRVTNAGSVASPVPIILSDDEEKETETHRYRKMSESASTTAAVTICDGGFSSADQVKYVSTSFEADYKRKCEMIEIKTKELINMERDLKMREELILWKENYLRKANDSSFLSVTDPSLLAHSNLAPSKDSGSECRPVMIAALATEKSAFTALSAREMNLMQKDQDILAERRRQAAILEQNKERAAVLEQRQLATKELMCTQVMRERNEVDVGERNQHADVFERRGLVTASVEMRDGPQLSVKQSEFDLSNSRQLPTVPSDKELTTSCQELLEAQREQRIAFLKQQWHAVAAELEKHKVAVPKPLVLVEDPGPSKSDVSHDKSRLYLPQPVNSARHKLPIATAQPMIRARVPCAPPLPQVNEVQPMSLNQPEEMDLCLEKKSDHFACPVAMDMTQSTDVRSHCDEGQDSDKMTCVAQDYFKRKFYRHHPSGSTAIVRSTASDHLEPIYTEPHVQFEPTMNASRDMALGAPARCFTGQRPMEISECGSVSPIPQIDQSSSFHAGHSELNLNLQPAAAHLSAAIQQAQAIMTVRKRGRPKGSKNRMKLPKMTPQTPSMKLPSGFSAMNPRPLTTGFQLKDDRRPITIVTNHQLPVGGNANTFRWQPEFATRYAAFSNTKPLMSYSTNGPIDVTQPNLPCVQTTWGNESLTGRILPPITTAANVRTIPAFRSISGQGDETGNLSSYSKFEAGKFSGSNGTSDDPIPLKVRRLLASAELAVPNVIPPLSPPPPHSSEIAIAGDAKVNYRFNATGHDVIDLCNEDGRLKCQVGVEQHGGTSPSERYQHFSIDAESLRMRPIPRLSPIRGTISRISSLGYGVRDGDVTSPNGVARYQQGNDTMLDKMKSWMERKMQNQEAGSLEAVCEMTTSSLSKSASLITSRVNSSPVNAYNFSPLKPHPIDLSRRECPAAINIDVA